MEMPRRERRWERSRRAIMWPRAGKGMIRMCGGAEGEEIALDGFSIGGDE